MKTAYRALVSSDWNQCLAPTGPFDVIAYLHPHLKPDLEDIFGRYTGNHISLSDAMDQVQTLLPAPVGIAHLDAYLAGHFKVYPGVVDFMRTCRRKNILFMINTTAVIGYFQRAAAQKLIRSPAVLSAHPLIRYNRDKTEPDIILPLFETTDKGKNTEVIADQFNIPFHKIFVIGDSGGDGPHFEWGARAGATLIGSMTKDSLNRYCRERGITIDLHFGHTYAPDEKLSPAKEQAYDFMGLWDWIEERL
jgi:hypothetical protein